eukprot:Gb_35017 [translate_table: standard]
MPYDQSRSNSVSRTQEKQATPVDSRVVLVLPGGLKGPRTMLNEGEKSVLVHQGRKKYPRVCTVVMGLTIRLKHICIMCSRVRREMLLVDLHIPCAIREMQRAQEAYTYSGDVGQGGYTGGQGIQEGALPLRGPRCDQGTLKACASRRDHDSLQSWMAAPGNISCSLCVKGGGNIQEAVKSYPLQANQVPEPDANTDLLVPSEDPLDTCPNGHTLCSNCKSRVHNKCPTCRQDLGNIRCLALEKVAVSLDLPCKYHNLGCSDIFPYYSKLEHEAQCAFRPYNCPYAGSECSIMGDIPTLVAHLRDDHKVDMHNGCTFNHRYVKLNPREVENATWMLTVFNCFGQYFCLHFEAFQLGMAPVYMAFLRFMGDDSVAKNFSYSLEVGAKGRKLIWQGVPRSIRDSHRKVRDSHDGLIIQRNMALFFSGGDRKELKLRVTGRIWKEQ